MEGEKFNFPVGLIVSLLSPCNHSGFVIQMAPPATPQTLSLASISLPCCILLTAHRATLLGNVLAPQAPDIQRGVNNASFLPPASCLSSPVCFLTQCSHQTKSLMLVSTLSILSMVTVLLWMPSSRSIPLLATHRRADVWYI